MCQITPQYLKVLSVIRSLACVIGFSLSLYALYVERKSNESDDYSASCDISETISCSSALKSEYARIFQVLGIVNKESILNLPNAFYGK